MTMNDSDVRDILHRATDDLVGTPGLLLAVRRGGRRRVVRRRAVLAAVCAAVVAVPVVGGLQLAGDGGEVRVASPLLDEPTRGDLAADEGYLRQVREAWQRRLEQNGDQMRGEPHIVWAGSTPAGPAAYVAHRTAKNPVVSEPANDRMIAMAAFVEPTTEGPRVMTIETVTDAGTDGNSQAALLGPQRDVLLVLDFGQPVEFSPELKYMPDGKVKRTFQPVAFRDGAAVLAVQPQRTKITVGLARTPVRQENVVHITNAMAIMFPNGDSPAPRSLRYALPGAEQAWGGDPTTPEYQNKPGAQEVGVQGTEALAEYIDPVGAHRSDGSPLLSIYGVTPDSRRLLVETIQFDDEPARVIALLARNDEPFQAVASTFADWTAPLPVRLRLPDNQGIVVAAEGAALSYRIRDGKWQNAGRNAALLPADATDVRVTDASGTVTSIPVTT
ncbi:hypothetical protein GCM10022225_74270 [Plantactinospora mayteni]|uniref:Uncharacterized protein n=1 Tax=Plantactinospora mayteni TaxID=566021 RepID=A0ABQ4EW56_9ACTN|nr:hypothetical protein [Plantactinospora mayteni]GIG98915.1 hypothetical protein Pma05_54880 [Plantactinospora mayteni]